MNRESIETLKSIYKPYKYTILGNAHILSSSSGNVVLKERKNDLKELFQYLNTRGFTSYPKLVDDSRVGVNVFEYIEETQIPREQKAAELIKTVAKLHYQTSYYKDATEDDFKKIYELVKEKIDYLIYFYDNLYQDYFKIVYPSPHQYLLLNNYSKIYYALRYASKEIEKWYENSKNLSQYRVCQIHHHLSLQHFINGEKPSLISWENSSKDSPVLDIIEFYEKNFFDLNFQNLLSSYFSICPWDKEEKNLFYTVISIPPKFEEKGSEFEMVQKVRNILDYVYKTEELIKEENATEKIE